MPQSRGLRVVRPAARPRSFGLPAAARFRYWRVVPASSGRRPVRLRGEDRPVLDSGAEVQVAVRPVVVETMPSVRPSRLRIEHRLAHRVATRGVRCPLAAMQVPFEDPRSASGSPGPERRGCSADAKPGSQPAAWSADGGHRGLCLTASRGTRRGDARRDPQGLPGRADPGAPAHHRRPRHAQAAPHRGRGPARADHAPL